MFQPGLDLVSAWSLAGRVTGVLPSCRCPEAKRRSLPLPAAFKGFRRRIIGGWEAKPHSRPYMAFLSITSDTGGSYCGGFLIRPYAVVSAAHCVAGKKNVKISVTLGAHNIRKKEPSQQVFHIHHWVMHPKYSGDSHENDIMLLKLKPWAPLTEEVSQIPLARHNQRVLPGTVCNVAGWGWTSVTQDMTSVLMEVDLEVQSEKVCEEAFRCSYLRQSMICAGDENGKKSTFRGDSGGPLVCDGKAHGIVSYGHKNHLFPKVFTKVSYFEPWISQLCCLLLRFLATNISVFKLACVCSLLGNRVTRLMLLFQKVYVTPSVVSPKPPQ
ncbi:PREDICTED: duodenase-1-like [Buceros rhinoceros silvestris]|uniref:duodenase-1-like n=1 Tax=Buceros rhinoceros silvestris TaxID=175836 RepID=UPI000528AAAE|nr:PREDICTED: duodenase-1-like [Buceros rhinoceros silvestris]